MNSPLRVLKLLSDDATKAAAVIGVVAPISIIAMAPDDFGARSGQCRGSQLSEQEQ